ncbi:methyltransferase-like protein 17, mitochondrial [Daphnia carinata]|uniref:methyltransferase-like protein 17, mitochondrial n=1 Tax=Daphnia carinata TaxID=120202 RepID=UPI00257ACF3C|nr:methyltransferase-like protein 17, mitochondrial [Daphnia carinata]
MFSYRNLLHSRCYLSKNITSCSFGSSLRPIAKFDHPVNRDSNCPTLELPQKDSSFGIKSHNIVKLPERLKEAVDKILGSYQDRNLINNSESLNHHLIFKKPPLTESQLKQIEVSCTERVSATHLFPDMSFMSVDDEKRLSNSLNNKIRRSVKQTAYKWKPVVYNQSMAMAYLVARLAPDFASLYKIFSEIRSRDPGFQPQNLFDFGSGIGTALWSAKSCWGMDKFKEVFCVDSSVDMNNLAITLIQGGVWPNQQGESRVMGEDGTEGSSTLKGFYFRQFMPASPAVKYDLVVCAHTLLELPSAELRLQMALSLWRKSQGYLVFVEHGSRAAYEVIVEIRDFLLSLSDEGKEANLEGHVFSPCPHEARCPRFADSTPCNFEAKYESLMKKQQVLKERFSYVVLKKGPRSETDSRWPRVVRPVLTRSGHTICRLCTNEGKLEEIVVTRSKHSKEDNTIARKTKWGDLLPVQLSHHEAQRDHSPDDKENFKLS